MVSRYLIQSGSNNVHITDVVYKLHLMKTVLHGRALVGMLVYCSSMDVTQDGETSIVMKSVVELKG